MFLNIMDKKHLSGEEFKQIYPDLYDVVSQYYPIGITRNDVSYEQYGGIKKLYKLLDYYIINSNNYSSLWEGKIIEKLELKLNKKVLGATYGPVPSHSGLIELDINNDLRYILYFYVSLLDKYFSIEVFEFEKKKIFDDEKYYWITKSVTVSPEGKYKNIFVDVENFLYEEFVGYKFLPAYFDCVNIENLWVTYNDFENNSISNCLFSKIQKEPNTRILGDINYGDIKT